MPKSTPATPNKQQPEDWSALLSEFHQKCGRGFTKTYIRKLWATVDDMISYANPSELRMMFCSPPLLICPEGVNFIASVLVKIEIKNGLTLFEKMVMRNEVVDSDCQRYGEVFLRSWMAAHEKGEHDVMDMIKTEVFIVLFQKALYAHKPLCTKFQKTIEVFAPARAENTDFLNLILEILNGCLYTALEANNVIVRASALEVFYAFFPFISGEDLINGLERQLTCIKRLCQSDVVSIRSEAAKRTLSALTRYWLILPKDKVKDIASFIIDLLARDSVVGVRAAVFEGLSKIAYEPMCLAIYQRGMQVATVPGTQDKSERVRIAAYRSLLPLKNHRYVSVFDMHDRDDLIALLELENVEECRRAFMPIMHIVLPMSDKLDEKYYRPRIDYILGKSRLTMLTYFRLLGPAKIIEPGHAAKLIEMLITWAYRYLRCKDTPPLAETEEKFKKARSYLECALILYMSCKKMLIYDCEKLVKEKCDQLFGKIVKQIFDKYAGTPILGTATAISSVIPKESLKTVASDVLARLADDDVPPEAIEPFLESALHFNPDSVFDYINSGIDVLVDVYGAKQKQSKKKKRDDGTPDEVLTMALSRLKYIVQSHSTSSLLAKFDIYKTKFLEMVKKLDTIREAIEIRAVKKEGDEHLISDKTLLVVLEFRMMLPLYAVSENHEEDDRQFVISYMKKLLVWFDERIVQKMADFEEHNQEFMIQLVATFFDSLNVALSAYDFKTRPAEYEDDEDRENQEPGDEEKEDETTVAELIENIIKTFYSSGNPIEIICPLLRVGTTLCEDSYVETHERLAALLRFIPKWINKQFSVQDEEEEEEEEKTELAKAELDKNIAETLRQFHKKVSETDAWSKKNLTQMVAHFVMFSFMELSQDDEEYVDPRKEEYNPPRYVSLGIVKFILKDKSLTDALVDEVSMNYLQEDSKYFTKNEEDKQTKVKLEKLGVLSLFLRILERYSKSRRNWISEAIGTCTTRALDYFANLPDLEAVDHQIVNNLSILLDIDLPDGF